MTIILYRYCVELVDKYKEAYDNMVNLRSIGLPVRMAPRSIKDDYGFHRTLMDVWNKGEQLLCFDGTLVPTEDEINEILSCGEPDCAYACKANMSHDGGQSNGQRNWTMLKPRDDSSTVMLPYDERPEFIGNGYVSGSSTKVSVETQRKVTPACVPWGIDDWFWQRGSGVRYHIHYGKDGKGMRKLSALWD